MTRAPFSICVAIAVALSACAAARPLVAESDDLTDYRAFRVAAREETRLARAQHYIAAHPRGAWIDEVRAAFVAEEPAFFEAAKTSRRKAIEYLVALPRGPHAEAAYSVLSAFDAKDDDFETTKLLAEARRTDALLEHAAERRRAVGERILACVSALLAPGVYGVRVDETPASLRRVLGGMSATTWGAMRTRVDVDVPFAIPIPTGREERVASIELSLKLDAAGTVSEGRVWGPDLFVRWAEADTIRSIDASAPQARGAAATHAKEVLSGAFEALLPADRCVAQLTIAGEILARRCDGWTVSVTMGDFAGAPDVILVKGPTK